MRVTIPVVRVSGWAQVVASAVLLALLVAIGGMRATTPVAAQERITQAPTLPGSRNLTQSPYIGSVYPNPAAPRDRPNPISIPTSARAVAPQDDPDILYIPTAPRPSLDRPDPLYIPTLPR